MACAIYNLAPNVIWLSELVALVLLCSERPYDVAADSLIVLAIQLSLDRKLWASI